MQGESDDDSSDEDQFTGKNALKAIADDSTSKITSSSDEESLIGKMNIRTLNPPRTFFNETVFLSVCRFAFMKTQIIKSKTVGLTVPTN